MRLLRTALLLAAILCIPFFIWGDHFSRWFTGDAAVQWIRALGIWGSAGVVGLLTADLVLPLPSTAIMSAAGFLYGTWIGGALSALGSFCSGLLGYGLCRAFGRRAAARLTDAGSLARNETLFAKRGPILIAMSRWMPLLPEVMCCLAGIARMPLGTFCLALACGSVPVGFAYAAIGRAGQENPAAAIGLSVLVPPVLWALASPWLRRHSPPDAAATNPSRGAS